MVRCLEQLKENENLVSGSYDKTIKIWNLEIEECIKTFECQSPVLCLKQLSSNKIACGCIDSLILVWNLLTGEKEQVLNGHSNFVRSIQLRENYDQLVSCSYDTTIKVWCLTSGNCVMTLREHTKPVNSIQINKNGLLFSGSYDKTVKIWDLDTGECIQSIAEEYPIDLMELCTISFLG